jgi:osmotically-inducible protein OsmY
LRSYRFAVAALYLVGSALTAATVPVHKSTAPAAPAAARPRQAALPDADIEKAIRARFAASKISSHHFQVHVQGGVATIEGQTDVLQHKGTATRLAKSAGATRVVNHIAVSQAAKDKAAGNLAKGRRRAQIKRSEVSQRSQKRSS